MSPTLVAYRLLRNAADAAQRRSLSKLKIIPECGAGCTWCCTHDQGTLTRREAVALAEIVDATPALADVKEKVRTEVERLSGKLVARQTARGTPSIVPDGKPGDCPCPFLSGPGGLCRVYPDRPLSCVCTFSTSRAACEALALRNEGNGWAVPKDVQTRVAFGVVKRLGPREQMLLAHRDAESREWELPIVVALGLVWFGEEAVKLVHRRGDNA